MLKFIITISLQVYCFVIKVSSCTISCHIPLQCPIIQSRVLQIFKTLEKYSKIFRSYLKKKNKKEKEIKENASGNLKLRKNVHSHILYRPLSN